MLPRNYPWVIRLRSDAWVPFRLRALPSPEVFGPIGTAITGYVGFCQACRSWVCDPTTLCRYTSDQFALLAGPRAQRIYLEDFGHDFCRRTAPLTIVGGMELGARGWAQEGDWLHPTRLQLEFAAPCSLFPANCELLTANC